MYKKNNVLSSTIVEKGTMKIEIQRWKWERVYKIDRGAQLKGRSSIYQALKKSCRNRWGRFGCYAWKIGRSVRYIGSFSRDYESKQHKTNLEGRVHNYWYNHGNGSTNKLVFDRIKKAATKSSVTLCVLRPGKIKIDSKYLSKNYSQSPDMVLLIERLLLYYHRTLGKKKLWNRK